MMGKLLLLLLIVIPTLEIFVLILFGDIFGAPLTILLLILTGIIGAVLAKTQGLYAIRKAQEQLSQGQIPSGILLDGICILIGGIALLAPGFITDFFGLLLLIPFTRKFVKHLLSKWFDKMIRSGNVIYFSNRRW